MVRVRQNVIRRPDVIYRLVSIFCLFRLLVVIETRLELAFAGGI